MAISRANIAKQVLGSKKKTPKVKATKKSNQFPSFDRPRRTRRAKRIMK